MIPNNFHSLQKLLHR